MIGALPLFRTRRACGAQKAARDFRTVARVIVWAERRSRLLPGLCGAGMVAYGVAMVYLPAGVIAGGLFLLAMDRQIQIRKPSG